MKINLELRFKILDLDWLRTKSKLVNCNWDLTSGVSYPLPYEGSPVAGEGWVPL